MVRPTAVITPMTRRTVPAEMPGVPAHVAQVDVAGSAKPDFAPVIRSKIQPPALRADTLRRERLVRRLDEALTARVVLVVADAGYGKTTLLADYAARSGFRTLWYRLGASDADAVTWTNYLVAACREVDPTFGEATTRLLTSSATGGPPKSAFIESFLGELGRWHEAPTLLVLDDFHEVDRHVEVADIASRLVDDAPDWLHIVISGRRRPSLALGRLAATAQLAEIGTDDLRFSLIETDRLFSESYSQPLDVEVLEELDRRTRGWAASLQLFHGSIRDRPADDVRRLVQSLSGAASPVYDFLAEEVLGNVEPAVADYLVRASVLDRIVPEYIAPLFDAEQMSPTVEMTRAWTNEAHALGLISRSSESSEGFDLHPLLRDFLLRQLESRVSRPEMKGMHARLARAMRKEDPLNACHHFIEAGEPELAMDCLDTSVTTTIGSAQWGVASDLIGRLTSVRVRPSVAAIQARGLLAEGDLDGAERLLAGIELADCPPDIRAAVRQNWMSLAWRNGDRELFRRTLDELLADDETPELVREIADIFVDAGSLSISDAKPLPQLGVRLRSMAVLQRRAGQHFYGAVSLHNACVALLNAAEYETAVQVGTAALEAFEQLGVEVAEQSSTHSVMALALLELGRKEEAYRHADRAMNGKEFADVPAELALASACLGFRTEALAYIGQAEALSRQGRTDSAGGPLIDAAKAVAALPEDAPTAVRLLSGATMDSQLDLGQVLLRRSLLALAHLVGGDVQQCLNIAVPALEDAHLRSEKRAAARLAVLVALAQNDEERGRVAIAEASQAGQLALAELADAICDAGSLLAINRKEIDEAITANPERWLPALRRQLGKGAPQGYEAAQLLDRHGEFRDLSRLRAFSKAYKRRGVSPQLGIGLAKRTSPRLTIRDLGPVRLEVGERTVFLSTMRKKAAALLMYLVTRPSFTANREQILDELWPDADPAGATNSLNQSLYFLRRDINPWHEDEFSVDYVHFAGDLVWLDESLVAAASAGFLREAGLIRGHAPEATNAIKLITAFRGRFAPEFEYEEWAMDWRSRVHSVLLDLAHWSIERLSQEGMISEARDVAIALLEIDPSASDIEQRLIWLLWQDGASSAAKAQYQHLARVAARDGIDAESFDDIVNWRASPAI